MDLADQLDVSGLLQEAEAFQQVRGLRVTPGAVKSLPERGPDNRENVMKILRSLVLAMAVLVPATALADPITAGGTWSNPSATFGDPSLEGTAISPFWSGLSWDCALCGVGFLIDASGTDGLEYLHNGSGQASAFRFDPEDEISLPSLLFSITGWTNGTLGRRADGAFTYDTGTGYVSNSWDNPEQYALFRLVGPETTRYFLGIEDIPVSIENNDKDYNDYVVSFTQPTHSVPEPSSLLLMGCAMAVAGVRRFRASRPNRFVAAI
jgi:hypothetical protein